MSEEPQPIEVDIEVEAHVAANKETPPSDRDDESEGSEDESEPEAPADLMVTTRAKRSNAGNRMSTLLAKSAEEEEWGEEWEDAPNEEEFRGDDVNEQEDYNMDSSSSEEGDDDGDEDEAGEKELRKAERQEKNKKRKAATNPFAARVAAVTRKKVKLDVPDEQSSSLPPRPKKKSERASWIPTEEDGPVRTSSRKQTIANKETTMAKLKEKDRRRDDTLAMMKAAEARKAKAKEPPLTQAERLAEAARNERINKKTLHRWEEAEEARAAERQAKIDALKNRQMEGPFIRYYSGPAVWVDDKLKYTGKDAPSLDQLEEKINKDFVNGEYRKPPPETTEPAVNSPAPEPVHEHHDPNAEALPSTGAMDHFPDSIHATEAPTVPITEAQQEISQMPWTAASQGGDVFMGSHGMSYPSNIMFAPPTQDAFLYGIDQYAQHQPYQSSHSDLPPNPFTQASPYQQQYATTQSPFPQPSTSLDDPLHTHNPNIGPEALLSQLQHPPLPPAPPRRKLIRRALRNLLILTSFPNLDAPPSLSSRARTTATLLKDRDRSALIHLSSSLFAWSLPDATTYVTAMLAAATSKPTKKAQAATEAALKPSHKTCPITNAVARYRDPETGIAYRDARAFGVLRGVVGGGFVWSGDLGCYVGGRAKPLESMGGKGFLGMPPAKNVPRRFWEMAAKKPVTVAVEGPTAAQGAKGAVGETARVEEGKGVVETNVQVESGDVKMEVEGTKAA